MKNIFQKIIAICLVLIMSFAVVACSDNSNNNNNDDDSGNNTPGGEIIVDGVTIQDSFISLQFEDIVVVESSIENVSVQDILLHTVEVTDIEVIELDLTTINDEFVYLAYKNFVEFYDADIDWAQFIKDVAIGAGVVIVMVTLSTVAGPVGTFFGGVIASEFTAGALVIGAAIDAAVSGYMAYQEGGDLSYILGHMLQGVGEGFKFGAFLAPLSGAVSGIKALKAVSKLTKVPGFENLTQKEASALLKNTAKILSGTKHLAKEATDGALKEAYQATAKNLSAEITEELFIKAFRQQSNLISLIKATNAFNTASDLIKSMKTDFMSKAGVADDVGKAIIKKLQNHTIKNIDDITDVAVKNYIDQNLGEFVELFGKSITKDFMDNLLERKLGKDSVEAIVGSIAKSKNAYSEIVEKIGKESIDNALSSADSLILLQARYGSKNVINLMKTQTLYNCLLQDNQISNTAIKQIIDGFIGGTVKSIDDVSQISKQAAKNARYSREVLIQSIKDMGLGKKLSGFIDDLVVDKMMMHVSKDAITDSVMKDIVGNTLTKSQIIQKYGQRVYNEFVDKAQFTMGALGIQNSLNKTLLNEVLQDSLLSKSISSEAISRIMKGAPVSTWGVSDNIIKETWQMVGLYYKSFDKELYDNFVSEIADSRGTWIKEFIEAYELSGNTIRNKAKFAGTIMEPTGKNAKYIKEKYGDIFMSETGFVKFDQHSIAQFVSDGLTGANGGQDDIIKANLVNYGVQSTPKGYTWHHLEDGKTMILIPTDLHEAYRHTGGADLLREGLKDFQ